jgi:hypothetical protein
MFDNVTYNQKTAGIESSVPNDVRFGGAGANEVNSELNVARVSIERDHAWADESMGRSLP